MIVLSWKKGIKRKCEGHHWCLMVDVCHDHIKPRFSYPFKYFKSKLQKPLDYSNRCTRWIRQISFPRNIGTSIRDLGGPWESKRRSRCDGPCAPLRKIAPWQTIGPGYACFLRKLRISMIPWKFYAHFVEAEMYIVMNIYCSSNAPGHNSNEISLLILSELRPRA